MESIKENTEHIHTLERPVTAQTEVPQEEREDIAYEESKEVEGASAEEPVSMVSPFFSY